MSNPLVQIDVYDSELEIIRVLAAKTPHQFSVGDWLMQKLYDQGLIHNLAVQQVRTSRDGDKTVVLVEQ